MLGTSEKLDEERNSKTLKEGVSVEMGRGCNLEENLEKLMHSSATAHDPFV